MTIIECAGVLFDFDGVLADSTPVVRRHWTAFAERHGLDAAQIIAAAHGRRSADTIADVCPPGADAAAELRWFDGLEISDVEGVLELAGTAELLAALPAGRWGVVTSANREVFAARMASVGLPVPDLVVAAEDVERGKPDPEGYLAGARWLDIDPADCLVVEDSPAGLKAAAAAGMRSLGLLTTHSREQLTAWKVAADLSAVRVLPSEAGVRLDVTEAPS